MKREISPFIRLNPKDNVVVARRDVPAGMAVESEGFTTRTGGARGLQGCGQGHPEGGADSQVQHLHRLCSGGHPRRHHTDCP